MTPSAENLKLQSRLVKETGTKIDTIYFGGGTPTSITTDELRTIMEGVAKNFDLDSVREYSVEAGRPDTITEEKLRVIKELGAERISVNPQTLNDDVLKVIGRKHTGDDFLRSYELARKVGFTNINTDLIAGLPTESAESFRNTLDRIIDLDPESITVHTLTLKRAAALFANGKDYAYNPASEMVDYSIKKLWTTDICRTICIVRRTRWIILKMSVTQRKALKAGIIFLLWTKLRQFSVQDVLRRRSLYMRADGLSESIIINFRMSTLTVLTSLWRRRRRQKNA